MVRSNNQKPTKHQTKICNNNKYRTSLLFFGPLVYFAYIYNTKDFTQHSAYIWSGQGTFIVLVYGGRASIKNVVDVELILVYDE